MPCINIIGIGALNVDNILRVERILEDGEAVARESASFPGGSAANTIYGLGKLGVKAGFIGAVGDDADGRLLKEDFERVSVETGHIAVKPGAKSGMTLCLSDKRHRSIYILPGANSLLTASDMDSSYINGAGWLHVSSFVDEAQLGSLHEMIKYLAPSVRLSFSPGTLYARKGLEALEQLLEKTYILFLNRDEIRLLTGENTSAGSEVCLERGCRTVVVTLGGEKDDGHGNAVCYIRTPDREETIESAKGGILTGDTTGAGDAFAAGFLYGLINDRDLKTCGHLGDIVARFSITGMGAREGLPTLDDLSKHYRRLHNREL